MTDRKLKGRIEVKAGAGGLRVAKAHGRETHFPGPRRCWSIMPRLSSVACRDLQCQHAACAYYRPLTRAVCHLCGSTIQADENFSSRGLLFLHLVCERSQGGVV